jgi:hypothetical protein
MLLRGVSGWRLGSGVPCGIDLTRFNVIGYAR